MKARMTVYSTPSPEAPYGRPSAEQRITAPARSLQWDHQLRHRWRSGHGLPFAACRVIIDPVDRALPPAALIDLRPDGTPDVPRVLRSVLRNPCQVPALLRVAANAHAAHLALRAGRQHLGDGLRFPEFR